MREITEIYIHCSAMPNGRSKWTILDIDDWHKRRNFKRMYAARKRAREYLTSVGYHAYINADGSLAPGRADWEVGAGVLGYNKNSLHVCLAGTDKFTLPQWEALKSWIIDKKLKYPDATIYGHNDRTDLKECPGFDVQKWLYSKMTPLEGHIHE